ncbi:MAG: hypothetical protein LBH74_07240 [Nitrososphaerota archaeon]|jgi:hypothetical protein|nr:hypothetical protein [Nitrososphaerota archaeon]
MSLGIYLSLLIGEKVPKPAPASLMDALQNVEVTVSDQSRDGFQLSFSIGRGGADTQEYSLLSNPLIKPFNRVIIMVAFGVVPKVLIDGIITHHQVNPSHEPGKSTFSITGEDLSVMMDLKDKNEEHPDQSAADIVTKIVRTYSQYDLKPEVITPDSMSKPTEIRDRPSQHTSDLAYIRKLAGLYKYVFYVEPTDSPKNNIAYWGPPDRKGRPQKELSFNMGEATNVNSINFQLNPLSQRSLKGKIQDTEKGTPVDVPSELPNSNPPLAAQPVDEIDSANRITKQLRISGVSIQETMTMAQAEAQHSADALTVSGELDSSRYGDVLRARHPVTLRGVGQSYNGLYYVKKVTHSLSKGSYKQSFTLSREGLGTTVTKVDKKA